jgi:hypothetical protein
MMGEKRQIDPEDAYWRMHEPPNEADEPVEDEHGPIEDEAHESPKND